MTTSDDTPMGLWGLQKKRPRRQLIQSLVVAILTFCIIQVLMAANRHDWSSEPARSTTTTVTSSGAPDPELVSVEDDSGAVVGYARKADVASPSAAPATIVDVWDATGKRLVGHVYPNGTGFLSITQERKLGVSPSNPPEAKNTPTTAVG